jgi:DNA primase large subunit
VGGHGEVHGCPFRSLKEDEMGELLNTMGIEKEKDEIVKKAKEGHYQIACTKCYEAKNHTVLLEPIDHPNRWFDQSMGRLESTES